jgi:hypothetical protein
MQVLVEVQLVCACKKLRAQNKNEQREEGIHYQGAAVLAASLPAESTRRSDTTNGRAASSSAATAKLSTYYLADKLRLCVVVFCATVVELSA